MAQVSQEVLEKIIQRIVEVAQPERIILFGSAARGQMVPHSDVDLLVVKSGGGLVNKCGKRVHHRSALG